MSQADAAPALHTVGAHLDRQPLTRTHWRLVTVVGAGLLFDAYEIFLSGPLAAVLTAKFGVTGDPLKWVIASNFIGQFVGAIIFGILADRLGRRTGFLLNLAIYSAFSMLVGLAPALVLLIVARMISGLGMGAEGPVSDSYLTDVLPSAVRGRMIAAAYTVAFLGIPLAGFLSQGIAATDILGIEGWRWLFFIGAVGGACVFMARRSLPESPRWLENVGRHDEAIEAARRLTPGGAVPNVARPGSNTGVGSVTSRFRDVLTAPYQTRYVMFAILNLFQTVGYYGFGTLVPLILLSRGFTLVSTLGYTAVTFLGYPLGSLLAMGVIERLGRKRLLVTSAVLIAASGVGFAFSATPGLILTFGIGYTLVSNVFSAALHAYGPELFPTGIRASAVGTCYSLSRLSTGLMPFLLLPVLDHFGATVVLAILAGSMIICALDVAILGPDTRPRSSLST